jgi:cytoskeletal protein RodZ
MFEIGNTLREARLRRGLDILDCEAETKIRAKYLRAMEEEQFDLMPSPTYVRGFLRTYADFLDLDGRLVLDEYESRFGTYSVAGEGYGRSPRERRPPRPGHEHRTRADGPRSTPRPRRRRRSEMQLLWLAIGGVMTVALLIWLGVGSNDTPPPVPAAASPSATTTSVPKVVEPDTAATEAPVRTKPTLVVLTGTGTHGCWVQVRPTDGNGRIVYEQILAPGQSKTFRIRAPIWMRAANPAELQVTVAGKARELNSTNTGDWTISPQGVTSAS